MSYFRYTGPTIVDFSVIWGSERRCVIRSIRIFIFVLGLVLVGAGVFLQYRFVSRFFTGVGDLQAKVIDLDKRLQERKNAPKVVETVVSKCQPWGLLQQRVRDTVGRVSVHVVEFNWLQPYKTPRQKEASGSGFFINEEGDFITNAHVVNQAYAIGIQISSMGQEIFDMTVKGVSFERDLALLQLSEHGKERIRSVLGEIPYLKLGDADVVRRADEIMALGYPLGQEYLKSTVGVISGKEHDRIQMDAAINPGSSGGPVLNIDGKVVGISSSGVVSAQNVGYIIPVNELKLILNDLYTERLLRKPFLGVFSNPASIDLTEFLGNPLPGGCYIVDVYKGSPLHKSGVRSGDMIYEMDGHTVDLYGQMQVPWSEDRITLLDYVSRLELGQKISFVVYRKGKRFDFSTTFEHAQLPPIRVMHPGYEEIDYEVIGGFVVMELARNHLPYLVNQVPSLIRYEDIKNQLDSTLIITHVFPGSQAQRCRALFQGMIIKEINGVAVKSLAEFRQAVQKSLGTGYLTVKTTDDIMAALNFVNVMQDEPRLSRDYRYPPTQLVRGLVQKIFGGPVSSSITPEQ